ncbi:hypothetical protein LXL04_011243 [Taraxacum kok-saghyz]
MSGFLGYLVEGFCGIWLFRSISLKSNDAKENKILKITAQNADGNGSFVFTSLLFAFKTYWSVFKAFSVVFKGYNRCNTRFIKKILIGNRSGRRRSGTYKTREEDREPTKLLLIFVDREEDRESQWEKIGKKIGNLQEIEIEEDQESQLLLPSILQTYRN